jgi:hypothetical protein
MYSLRRMRMGLTFHTFKMKGASLRSGQLLRLNWQLQVGAHTNRYHLSFQLTRSFLILQKRPVDPNYWSTS